MALSRREQARALFAQSQKILRCPLCGKGVRMASGGSLLCKNKHAFDLSRNGYLNLAGSGSLPGYDKALFQQRREVFAGGFYEPLLQELARILAGQEPGGYVLDAGCGEGYYAACLSRTPALAQSRFFGVDLSRDAVDLAARRDAPVCWCVADLARLPFRDNTMDSVLDILSPANYREFARVLKPGGIVIKVIPGPGYLREIRKAAAAQIRSNAHSGQDADAYMRAHMRIIETRQVCVSYAVTPEQALCFFGMTPMTVHVEQLEQLAPDVQSVSLDLKVLVGMFQ